MLIIYTAIPVPAAPAAPRFQLPIRRPYCILLSNNMLSLMGMGMGSPMGSPFFALLIYKGTAGHYTPSRVFLRSSGTARPISLKFCMSQEEMKGYQRG